MSQSASLEISESTSQDQTADKILKAINEAGAEYVDFRFTDSLGTWHHVTFHETSVDKDSLIGGIMFDGSSIKGWKSIEDSDMVLVPTADKLYLDPFTEKPTLIVTCNVNEPSTGKPYHKDPRSTALAAENYLKLSGIADTAFFGPEPEFFLFDEVHYQANSHASYYAIDSVEGPYPTIPGFSSIAMSERANGHRPSTGAGYFPVSPVDQGGNIRTEIIETLNQVGLEGEKCHHEVAVSQHEIGFKYSTLLGTADNLQAFKYVVRNVAHDHGMTATFMPKPVLGDNGSGMHIHISLSKDDKNTFMGDQYSNLSQEAVFFIGGILKHARALNAFTNPTTNSYKRLVPGFEAPIFKAYSARNRSAAVRIPYVSNPNARRIEIRFPDPTANPYLALAAILMAGLDGIENKIDPGPAMEKNLFDMNENDLGKEDLLCTSLMDALRELDEDRDFLTKGDVFTNQQIDGYIALRQSELIRVSQAPHPVEFELYYSS